MSRIHNPQNHSGEPLATVAQYEAADETLKTIITEAYKAADKVLENTIREAYEAADVQLRESFQAADALLQEDIDSVKYYPFSVDTKKDGYEIASADTDPGSVGNVTAILFDKSHIKGTKLHSVIIPILDANPREKESILSSHLIYYKNNDEEVSSITTNVIDATNDGPPYTVEYIFDDVEIDTENIKVGYNVPTSNVETVNGRKGLIKVATLTNNGVTVTDSCKIITCNPEAHPVEETLVNKCPHATLVTMGIINDKVTENADSIKNNANEIKSLEESLNAEVSRSTNKDTELAE